MKYLQTYLLATTSTNIYLQYNLTLAHESFARRNLNGEENGQEAPISYHKKVDSDVHFDIMGRGGIESPDLLYEKKRSESSQEG